MPELNPLANEQIFLKKIAENTGSDYNTGDVSEINPLTIDQILLKEIAANTAGQSGDITELEEKVTANTSAIEAIEKTYGSKNLLPLDLNVIKSFNSNATWNGNSCQLNGITFDFITDNRGAISSIEISGTSTAYVSIALIDAGKLNVILNSATECILSGFEEKLHGALVAYEQYYNNDWHDVAYDFNGGVFTYNTSSTVDEVRIRIDSGVAISGKAVVKPMIRDARITDPTYVPYAMTNRELTDAVNRGSVSVTADGVKTYAQILSDLHSLIDISKVSLSTTKFVHSSAEVYCSPLVFRQSMNDHLQFCGAVVLYNNEIHNDIFSFLVQDNLYTYKEAVVTGSGNTIIDRSSEIPSSGVVFTVYY